MSPLPPDRAPDWSDSFGGPPRADYPTARDAFQAALASPPRWLNGAMRLRNAVVRPFGLHTGDGMGFLDQMPIIADRPDYFETGLVDRHLTFSIATRLGATQVWATTRIWFNHPLGRVYLAVIKPGHILATRSLIGRIAHPVTRCIGEPEGLLQ